MGAFQGNPNPLSLKFIIDSCVMPVLLFACGNWLYQKSEFSEGAARGYSATGVGAVDIRDLLLVILNHASTW